MKKLYIALTIMALAVACSSNDSSESVSNDGNYDRTALLTNWADNIIIPAYTNYQAKVNVLNQNVTTFTATPTTTNLETLRQSWVDAYKAYQHVGIFDTGKSEELYLIASSNTYPTDVIGINTNITTCNYNFNQQIQYTRQGFPALDYIINGLATDDNAIVTFYSTNANAANYKKYLTDVAAQLKTIVDAIVADWNGGYRATFISKTNTSVSSSINQTTNNFIKNLEKDVRAPKLGIPAGLFSNGTTFPDKVEAYYKKDISKALLIEALNASHDFFNGKYFATDATGPSLKGYLDAVGAGGDNKLSDVINTNYTAAFSAITPLNDNFSQQIVTDNTAAVNAYNAIQKVVVLTKLDMISALNISIDYVDGDGD